jgi:hypothetical protein
MSSTTKTDIPSGLDARVLTRILEEGYGPGAWHGNDIKAAIEDVKAENAFSRPGPGRHSIAEIALHHAFYVHSVRSRMSPKSIEPFALEGDDWFALEANGPLTWSAIKTLVGSLHDRLAAFVGDVAAGRVNAKLTENERFELILGITCHGSYHAGQIQLIKALQQAAAS